MNSARTKQILQAAATLPPAKARRVVTALQAKAAAGESPEDYLAKAEDAMAAAMEMAVLATLEASLS